MGSRDGVWVLGLALAFAGLLPAGVATAQSATIDRGETAVTREYYTQLHASIDLVQMPDSGKPARNAFRSLLAALGGSSDARSITVGVQVSIGDVALPEYSLASYAFDSKTMHLAEYRNSGHDFPRKRLDPDEKIAVDVIFRDSSQVDTQLDGVAQSLVDLVPGATLVSLTSKPFVQSMGKLGSSVMGAVQGKETRRRFHYEFSPFGQGIKQVSLPLANQAGQPFAVVQLSLLATPTLLRSGRAVGAASGDDLVLAPDEDPATLALNLGGVRRGYLDELKGLSSYSELGRDHGRDSVRAFCSAARTLLGTQHGLTMLDRTALTLRALDDAGYQDRTVDTAWFHACFVPTETLALERATRMRVPAPGSGEPDELDRKTLFAFGCWMLANTGPQCAREAPDPEAALGSALAPSMEYQIDSSYLSTMDWKDPDVVSRDELLGALKATATGFSCFNRGMLLSKGEAVFRLEGKRRGGGIERIVIRPVPQDALRCTQ